MMEMGPSASDAYRARSATTELKPPINPQKIACTEKIPPINGSSKSKTTRPESDATAVTTTTRTLREAIAAKKSAEPYVIAVSKPRMAVSI